MAGLGGARWSIGLALASACLPAPSGGSGTDDSSTPVDDTGADDSGTDDTGTPSGSPLTVLTPGAASDAALGLFILVQAGDEGNDGTLVAASDAAQGSIELLLPETPPAADFADLPLEDDQTVHAAVYIPALWSDDGNLDREPSEGFLGVGQEGVFVWPIYLETVPSDFQSRGYDPGWNLAQIWFDSDMGDFVVGPNFSGTEITVDSNIPFRPDLDLRGDVDLPDLGSPRLTVMPINNVAFPKGTVENEALFDEALTDPWTIDVAGGPPADHYYEAYTAIEAVFAYADVGDDGFGSEDLGSDVGQVCTDDQAFVYATYTLVPDALTAMVFALNNTETGWNLFTEDDKGDTMRLPEADWARLHIGEDCYQ